MPFFKKSTASLAVRFSLVIKSHCFVEISVIFSIVFHILACCLTFIRYIHYIAVSALQQAYETQKAIPHENHHSYGFALLMGWLRKPTKPKKPFRFVNDRNGFLRFLWFSTLKSHITDTPDGNLLCLRSSMCGNRQPSDLFHLSEHRS